MCFIDQDGKEQIMELYSKKEECCGCGACADKCQAQAIRMLRDKEGFDYPHVDSSLCVRCGKCETVCPVKNDFHGTCKNQYMGAQAKADKIRHSSSSGGTFSILAEYILSRKGVVYGAGYSEQMEVVHQRISDLRQLEIIKRTKYVQSRTQGIFLSVEQSLKEERWVLFCGTPCQAHALRLFLGQEYEKLIIVDLVCYGVPSPGIWHDYVKYLERKNHGKMTDFSFRDKRAQDNGQTCTYVISGREYVGSLYADRFCRMYFRNKILRPSCHYCKYCMVERDSDFTIGDFWGIDRVRPNMDDGMGTSLIILHTDKAKDIWSQVCEDMNYFECEKNDLLQPRLLEPTGMAKEREHVMRLYRMLPFSVFIRWKRNT